MSYLSRREGRYHYRRRFPLPVAELLGRSEYRKALGTADRAEALRLARQVSVEFDRICSEALAPVANDPADRRASVPVDPRAVLASLQAVVERVTLRAVTDMAPGAKLVTRNWQTELDWQKRAYSMAAQGMPPPGMEAVHPLESMAAVRALEALERGEPPTLGTIIPGPVEAPVEPVSQQGDRRTAQQFAEALDGYCERVSAGRVGIMRKLCNDVLRWPSTPAQQVQRQRGRREFGHCWLELGGFDEE